MENSANQYIELYESQRELINANSASSLNALRDEACALLRRVGLKKSKDFSATDPEELLSYDYSLNLARYEVPTRKEDLFTCGIPELSTNLHFLVNEQYIAVSSSPLHPSAPAQQYFVGSLRVFAEQYPELIARY